MYTSDQLPQKTVEYCSRQLSDQEHSSHHLCLLQTAASRTVSADAEQCRLDSSTICTHYECKKNKHLEGMGIGRLIGVCVNIVFSCVCVCVCVNIVFACVCVCEHVVFARVCM